MAHPRAGGDPPARRVLAGVDSAAGDLCAILHQCAEQQQVAQQAGSSGVGAVLPVEMPRPAPAVLDTQNRRLFNSLVFVDAAVGLWEIYFEVLPALAIFEEVPLWTYTGTLDG